MPRIRTIKPEIASDAKLARVSRDARYTFVLAITQADDSGLLAGAPRQLLGALYPLDDEVTPDLLRGWIEELATRGLVCWRETRDGVPVLQIVNWKRHQRVDNAGRSQLQPLLTDHGTDGHQLDSESPAENRADSPSVAAVRGESPLGPTTTDLGPPTTDHRPPTTVEAAAMALSIQANKGLADHATKRQPIARIIATSGKSHEAAEAILAAGVQLPFAESRVYELAKTHRADGEVRSLNYFVEPVIRAWESEREGVAARHSSSVAPRARRAGNIAEQQRSNVALALAEDVT